MRLSQFSGFLRYQIQIQNSSVATKSLRKHHNIKIEKPNSQNCNQHTESDTCPYKCQCQNKKSVVLVLEPAIHFDLR